MSAPPVPISRNTPALGDRGGGGALTGKLGPGEGVAGGLAGLQADLGGQGVGVDVQLVGEGAAQGGVVRVAAEVHVVGDGGAAGLGEGGVLVDGELVVAAAGLAAVAGAGERAG